MKEREKVAEEDIRLDAVLSALREARPDDGLQERVLRRLQAEEARVSRGRWMPRWVPASAAWQARRAIPAMLVLCALIAFWNATHRPQRFTLYRTAVLRETAGDTASMSPAEAAMPRAGSREHTKSFSTPSAAATPIVSRNMAAGGERDSGTLPDGTKPLLADRNGSAREPSYPAPEMPLTEQERLLLQIAHQNDPVQVAMLDPVERTLAQARERAETSRFFKPTPLPTELQQQVNAALRSQYVNTPPPSDLLAETADRSQP